MLVPKEKIEEAKERLGDRNFELIMENLGITEYDSKGMKCSCPFHAGDKNPSFVYDKKRFRMHCFGCSTNVDLIDAVSKGQNKTYLEACEYLFKEAEIQFSFGEKNVRIQPKEYRYPTLPSKENDMSQVISYWEHRGISKETLDYVDVRSDEHGNSVFITFDLNDVPTVVKYKPSHKIDKKSGEPKNWFQKNADKDDLLFNMNRINVTEPLVICEGEPDTLTAIECGYRNVVSPLNGATSYGWISRCWDFLEQFEKIIVCSDNDAAGRKMRDELIYRLGSWRCAFVNIPETVEWDVNGEKKTYPVNDLNDYMLAYSKDDVLKAILHPTETPVKSVTDYADVKGIDLSEMDGIETGLSAIDDELYKLYYGTLTILTGRPGAGKSSIINAILANCMQENIPAWLFSREMPVWITKSWTDLQLAGPRNVEQKVDRKGHVYYSVSNNVKSKIDEWSRGKLFLYNDGEPNDADSIFQSMESCVRKFGVHLLVIDNLMVVNLGDNGGNELKAQTEFISRLVEFAIKYRVAIILAAHPRKKQAGEPTDADLTMDDVAGSANIINLAHRSIALRRVTQKEKEDPTSKYGNYNVKVTITKDRLLGKTDIGFGLYYDIPSRRFYSNYDEYAFDYGWDKNVYTEPLDVPECLLRERAMQEQEQEADEYVFGRTA